MTICISLLYRLICIAPWAGIVMGASKALQIRRIAILGDTVSVAEHKEIGILDSIP